MSQPIVEYPNPEITRQPDSSQSSGSFGPAFAVLAVIVVISAVACVLGRLCSKRGHRTKEASKQSKELGPKEWESRQKPSFNVKTDIEFGFDKRMPSGKGATKQGGGKQKPPHQKTQVRFSNNV